MPRRKKPTMAGLTWRRYKKKTATTGISRPSAYWEVACRLHGVQKVSAGTPGCQKCPEEQRYVNGVVPQAQ